MPFNDYFCQKFCTLICLGFAPRPARCCLPHMPAHTCNRSLNIFALFPFGFCKTSALQSCRNFPSSRLLLHCLPTLQQQHGSIFATEVASGNGRDKKKKKSAEKKSNDSRNNIRHRAAGVQCHCTVHSRPPEPAPISASSCHLPPACYSLYTCHQTQRESHKACQSIFVCSTSPSAHQLPRTGKIGTLAARTNALGHIGQRQWANAIPIAIANRQHTANRQDIY